MYITIDDNDPSSFSNEASDSSGKKGEEFHFKIDVSDNIGVSEVKVVYWFGDDESKNQSMILKEKGNTYSGSINPKQGGTLNFYYLVTDSAGNTMKSGEKSVNIVAPKPKEEEEDTGIFGLGSTMDLAIILLIIDYYINTAGGEYIEVNK